MAYPLVFARLLVALATAAVLFTALRWLDMPPLYRIVRAQNGLLFYQGHFLLSVASALAWFHHQAEQGLLWLGGKMQRCVSALMLSGFLLADGGMHLLNIPHMEGWWMPLMSGAAIAGGVATRLRQRIKKPQDSEPRAV